MKINILALFLLLCAPCVADVADPPVPTAENSAPVYYLIQNWKTKAFFLDDGSSNRFWSARDGMAMTETPDKYLFYFVKDGNGYKIGTKTAGSGKYMTTDVFVSDLRRDKMNATGVTWLINKCQYNNVGVEIHTADGNYWEDETKLDGFTYYGYIQLKSTADIDEQVWVLWSLDDLIEEAERHGVTGIDYEQLDPQAGSSFKTLVDAISAKQTTAYVNDFVSNFQDGQYLLRNRQYGTYLNTNENGMVPTMLPTQYSVWTITTLDRNGTLSITGYGAKPIRVVNSGTTSVTWTLLETSGTEWQPNFTHSTDNNNRYISFTADGNARNPRYFGMGKTTTETKTDAKPSVDWELIPVSHGQYERNGKTYKIQLSIHSEEELFADDKSQSPIVRLRNVTRSVADPTTDVFDGGGYLEDVDHVHFTHRKDEDPATKEKNEDPDKAFLYDATEAELMYSARTSEFYLAKPNDSHASALWQLQRVAQAATSHDAATGHILPEHNIYVVRNLNTGQYIKGSNSVAVDGRNYPVTTASEHEAAKFFLTKLIDGQYGFYLYHGTSASGIDAVDGGSIYADGQGDGYQGGLNWKSNIVPHLNESSAWVISPASTIELPLLVTGLTPEPGRQYDQLDWTTLYYPFDIVPAPADGQTVTIYQGGWAGQYEYDSGKKGGSIQMIPVADVPAGNAVFVTSSKSEGESYGNIRFNIYPAGSGQTTTTAETFGTNVWRGIVQSDDDPKYYWGSGSGWRDVWVLSRNASGYLRLLHPAGDYLLPNRAYIDVETVDLVNGGKVTAFDMLLGGGGNTTGITTVDGNADRNADWYTLDGRQLSSRPTAKGIYIYNGKKTIIR